MTEYPTLTNAQRQAIRSRLKKHPAWIEYRKLHKVNVNDFTRSRDLLELCDVLKLDWRKILDEFAKQNQVFKHDIPPSTHVDDPDTWDVQDDDESGKEPVEDGEEMARSDTVTRQDVVDIVEQALERVLGNTDTAPVTSTTESNGKVYHKDFPKLLLTVKASLASNARFNIYLAGPKSSGKTQAAKMVARELGLEYSIQGKALDAIELTGYVDAAGQYHSTVFVERYRNGGVILLDEMDGFSEEAALSINVPLSGDEMWLPNGENVKRHEKFVCIAAGNTLGSGADHQYTARNRLDESTLSRFPVVIDWNYDLQMERALLPDLRAAQTFARKCQVIRKVMQHLQFTSRVPDLRTMQAGVALLAAGMSKSDILSLTIFAGLDDAQRKSVEDEVQNWTFSSDQTEIVRK